MLSEFCLRVCIDSNVESLCILERVLEVVEHEPMQIRKRLKSKSEAPCCQNFAYAFAVTQMLKAGAYKKE